MRVLLLCDDYWHPAAVAAEGVRPLASRGFDFTALTHAGDFRAALLPQYDAVLLAKSDNTSREDKTPWKTEETQRAFADYVSGGGGLLAVHSALVPGKDTGILDTLIGCRFVTHPRECPVTAQPLKPHPVTEGVGAFRETDEHYIIEVLAPDADILFASYSPPQGSPEKYGSEPYDNCPGRVCACGFTRREGKGRVCALTPGHFPAVWQNPHFQRTLENALRWVSGA
ncbi:MAG: ThuA domain-containing protein [Oscillospiraceae bacterium]|jgi:type 1 glutamine amidotransferase|nr:ThuA domain-containing protein [Oscillospiraceae bacterium]